MTINKEESKKSSITRALFSPSAELLGRHLKEFVQTKLEQWKERNSEKNLSRLLAQVLKDTQDFEKLKEFADQKWENLELLATWAEGASFVGEEDEELADIWRQILREILDGKIHSKIIIDKLKELRSYEAALLIQISSVRCFTAHSEHEKCLAASLLDKGLIEHDPVYLIGTSISILMLMVLFAGVVFTFLVFALTNREFSPLFAVILAGALGGIAFVVGVPAGIAAVYKLTFKTQEGHYRITWLGRQLIRPLRRKEFKESLGEFRRLWHETVLQEICLATAKKMLSRFSSLLKKLTKRSSRCGKRRR